jgi:N-acetylglucosamine-6-phosphate deacetylase
VHAEGPYLHPDKKGAHDSSLFHPCTDSPSTVYGSENLKTIKLATIAPELPNSSTLIKQLTSTGTKVSLGHSTASFLQGLTGLNAGATCLTHTLNAMPVWSSRAPGLAGLIALPPTHTPPSPYYTLIADGEHLHPSSVSILYKNNPQKCIVVTDSIELAALPDGIYPGHSQIPHQQEKRGTRATIAGTDTLIGGCISLQEAVRNVMRWTGCGVAGAAATVTENVAGFMGIDGPGGRGVLTPGRRADLAVLDEGGHVLQTWVAGVKVWDREDEMRKGEEDGEGRG